MAPPEAIISDNVFGGSKNMRRFPLLGVQKGSE